MPETIAALVQAHRTGKIAPEQTVKRSFARIRAHGDPAIFISLREETDAVAEAKRLPASARDCALYGVPVAVKDNIDVAGLTTTAACPAFSYRPDKDAPAVANLRAAGAIVIGKTNLDQFATGLVGTRSPYGTPRNPFDPKIIPGGSSSGSAVAVAAGFVPLALGTDTAGSGRVPAALNNIVGLKPSLGMISTGGVVPACRTLDCVSVFTLTVDDAWTALTAMAGYDRSDPYSRHRPLGALGAMPPGVRLGVPKVPQRVFFGDANAHAAYDEALARLARLDAKLVEIDAEPFYAAARLLYEGPWLAERTIVAHKLIASTESMHPVTRQIIAAGTRLNALDAFTAFYKLAELRRASDEIFAGIDALALPTLPTVYTVDQVAADPIGVNSRLGTYTNFVNLLDLCGLAVPASIRPDQIPAGITLLAPAGHDALLAAIGRVFHADTGLSLGALDAQQSPLAALPAMPKAGEIVLAVVGAHLSGMSLNGDLRALGARLLERTTTTRDYRLYALAKADPPKPGLARVASGKGKAIDVEIWALPVEGFGQFVARVPPPLAIGTVRLADGRSVKGFLCEQEALKDAVDISRFGGWRAYVARATVDGSKRVSKHKVGKEKKNAKAKIVPRSAPRRATVKRVHARHRKRSPSP